MDQEKINLRQVRDFGETFNASFKFLRQNFKMFFKSLILIAGPFLLLSALASAFYQSNALTLSGRLQAELLVNPNISPMQLIFDQFGVAYIVFLITSIIANLIMVGTVYSFMVNYVEKGPGLFSVQDVTRTLMKNILGILGIFFVLLVLSLLVLSLIAAGGYAVGKASMALLPLLLLLLMCGMLIILPPIVWLCSAAYLSKMNDDSGVFQSLRKTRVVMKGNFWWTWVIVICSSIGVLLMAFVFKLPQIIYQVVLTFTMRNGDTETSIPFIVVVTICSFCATLVYSLLFIINGVHYYSLAEQKDGEGLMERINDIGNSTDTNVNQQY